jgi:hypothetical protein
VEVVFSGQHHKVSLPGENHSSFKPPPSELDFDSCSSFPAPEQKIAFKLEICTPSYSAGEGFSSLRPAQAKLVRPYLKNKI